MEAWPPEVVKVPETVKVEPGEVVPMPTLPVGDRIKSLEDAYILLS